MSNGRRNNIFLQILKPRNRRPKSRIDRIVAIINSPAFLVFLTFLFTGLFGTLISAMISDTQRRSDQSTLEIKDREGLWNSQEAQIVGAMSARLTDARLLASALKYGAQKDDINSRWQRYQESYRAYNLESPSNTMALRLFAGSGLGDTEILNTNHNNIFTVYKNLITIRLSILDGCLTKSYALYEKSPKQAMKLGTNKDTRTATGISLDGCIDDQTRKFFADKSKAVTFEKVSQPLSDCIVSYATELVNVMQGKHRVMETRTEADTNPKRYYSWALFWINTSEALNSTKRDVCLRYGKMTNEMKMACPTMPITADDLENANPLSLRCCPSGKDWTETLPHCAEGSK